MKETPRLARGLTLKAVLRRLFIAFLALAAPSALALALSLPVAAEATRLDRLIAPLLARQPPDGIRPDAAWRLQLQDGALRWHGEGERVWTRESDTSAGLRALVWLLGRLPIESPLRGRDELLLS